jgi:ubiquitin C-terminal hydrolase
MGNTCYLNSFMQALYMTKKFRTLIHNFTNDGRLASSKLQIYALHNLYDELNRKDFD